MKHKAIGEMFIMQTFSLFHRSSISVLRLSIQFHTLNASFHFNPRHQSAISLFGNLQLCHGHSYFYIITITNAPLFVIHSFFDIFYNFTTEHWTPVNELL